MADGKHIPGLKPGLAVPVALAKLLKTRFSLVVQRCRQIAPEAEAVHQLRVSTRRASAALRLAKELLPTKKRHRAAELLRQVRRAAGPVRDLDIFLHTTHSAANDSARAFLAGHAAHQRVADYQKLASVVRDHMAELTKLARTLPAAVDGDSEATFGDHVAALGHRHLRNFNKSLAGALEKHDPAHLHQLRIQAKRLRYTLEVDVVATGQVAHIEALQKILGDWHDAHALQPHLAAAKVAATSVNGAAGSPVVKGIDALLRNAQRVEAKELAAFHRWSKSWQAFQKRNLKPVS